MIVDARWCRREGKKFAHKLKVRCLLHPQLFKSGAWGKWKPYWFEVSGDNVMQYAKRGDSKPKGVIRLIGTTLKSADALTGETCSFVLFIPNKDPLYFRALTDEQKVRCAS